MKKYFSLICLLTILFCGCNQEELVNNQSTTSENRTFTASFEQKESRTYIEEGNLLRWTEGDQISLFIGSTFNNQYQFDGETGDNASTFSPVSQSAGTGNALNAHYAVYPYASDVEIAKEGVITATLPAVQSYAENSFGLGENTMVAVTKDTDDTFLKFKNIGGYLKFQLYGDDITVKTITLTGNNMEKLSGKATITAIYGEDPTVSMSSDANGTIILDCKEGVKIGSTKETATTFWMVVPPTAFETGFTITITNTEGKAFTKKTSNAISIERNVIKPMTAFEIKINPDDLPYLTFTANAAQTLSMSNTVETLEYSVNGNEWVQLGTSIVDFGGELGTLQLRGKSLTGTATSITKYSQISFGNNDVFVTCSGDIRTLIDYDNYNHANTEEARFCHLFSECKALISTPQLPATTLATDCYRSMFYKCYNLTQAPELPATTLANQCYANMFSQCVNLVQAPELPATTLAEGSYSSMFSCCNSLITAPELPAMTLAYRCYSSMFHECTNLTKAPKLPATTLADECYANMFYECYSLTQAPELPATTLAGGSYSGMFQHCSSLVEAPKLPATTLAESCYDHMFYDCNNLSEAPELPAMILADECYTSMFFGCNSLTKAPQLPATTLTRKCYSGMFSYCENLNEVPELPAMTLANECYSSMFSHCYNLEKAPVLPATTLVYKCYSGMFNYCSSLIKSPILPASILAYGCYSTMFKDCSKLAHITMLATDISAEKCLDRWISSNVSTGTFVKAAEMEDLPEGSNGIPTGWTVKNYEE